MPETERQHPYASAQFAKAYAALYWPELKTNGNLASFANSIKDQLPMRAAGDKPTRILALGFGWGGVELPLLYHLKAASKRPIDLVGIDVRPEPLTFAVRLLEDELEGLPEAAEAMGEMIDQKFPKQGLEDCDRRFRNSPTPGTSVTLTSGNDRFRFVWDDLCWEPLSDSMLPPAAVDRVQSTPQVSQWARRLKESSGYEEFDIVIAAFSLFHMPMWRGVLFKALDMLHPGGLFLHAKVQGDEALFEGRPGIEGSNSALARKLFLNGIFADKHVREITRRPRGASASQPYAIESYLRRLEDFGLTRLDHSSKSPAPTYDVSNEVGLQTYKGLVETRGFSTFRRIGKALDKAYERSLGDIWNNVLQSLSSEDEQQRDQLKIDFHWWVHRADSNIVKTFPLSPDFSPPDDTRSRALSKAYCYEYALRSASVLHNEPYDMDHADLARTIGSRMVHQRLMHSECPILQIGFVPSGQDRPQFFLVPSYNSNNHVPREMHIRQTALYLSLLRKSRDLSGGSNTQNLLNTLPKVFPGRTPIVVYEVVSDAKTWSVRVKNYLKYVELRIGVPGLGEASGRPVIDSATRNRICEQLTWLRNGRLCSPAHEQDDSRDELVFTPPSDAEEADLYWEKTDGIAPLYAQLKKLVPWAQKGLSDAASKALAGDPTASKLVEVLGTPRTAFTALTLNMLEKTGMVTFYPATYELGGRTVASDLIIASYTSLVPDDEIEAEFDKFSRMFERIRFHRAETAAENEERAHFAHNISAPILSLCTKLNELQGYLETHELPRAKCAVGVARRWADLVKSFYLLSKPVGGFAKSESLQELEVKSLLKLATTVATEEIRLRRGFPDRLAGDCPLPPGFGEDLRSNIAQRMVRTVVQDVEYLDRALSDHLVSTSDTLFTFNPIWTQCFFAGLVAQSVRHGYAAVVHEQVLNKDEPLDPERKTDVVDAFQISSDTSSFHLRSRASKSFDPRTTNSSKLIDSLNKHPDIGVVSWICDDTGDTPWSVLSVSHKMK